MATIAVYLLQSVFSGGLGSAPQKDATAKPGQEIMSTKQGDLGGLEVPSFVLSVPKNHFCGVSAPSKTLGEARKSAIADVAMQILGSVKAEYSHNFVNRASGSVRGLGPKHVVEDELSRVSRGTVLGIEKNIVDSSWCRDYSGKIVFFVLVRYPDEMIDEMRRLSKGAKIVASAGSISQETAVLKVSETNGVGVVLSSAKVEITKKYRFSKFISFCVWHVPQESSRTVSIALDPVTVCGNTQKIRLSLSGCDKVFVDYLLGAKIERVAVLKGQDELGRRVCTQISF